MTYCLNFTPVYKVRFTLTYKLLNILSLVDMGCLTHSLHVRDSSTLFKTIY